jgi:hypothetical protein
MKEYTNKENYMNERPRTFNQFYALLKLRNEKSIQEY